jgi:hypothetical protein
LEFDCSPAVVALLARSRAFIPELSGALEVGLCAKALENAPHAKNDSVKINTFLSMLLLVCGDERFLKYVRE